MVEVYEVIIKSPAGAPDETFRLIKCADDQIKDENRELYDCLNFILFDVKELSENKILLNAFASVTWTSWKSVSAYCELYNSCISGLRDKWAETGFVPEFYNRRAKTHQLKYILANCYNRAIEDPDKLNQYPPFSPQVYGETSFELISQMIETVSIGSEDTFIDLGSGVGQVVLQVAASCDVKFSYGIEKADYPAHCAVLLDKEFRRWMAFYGKKYQPYVLEQGDFLSDECTEKIVSSTVIFANNFAFGPEVDHQLKLRFANLKEGAKVIASKAFCSLNFRITDRKLDDIGSIMHVTCLNPIHDAVSWTDKPFSYYVHTIDRSSLEQYFARLKNPRLKNGDQNGAKKERRSRASAATTNSTEASQAGSTTSSVSESNSSQKPQGRRRKSKKMMKSRSDLLPSAAGSCGSPHCTPDGFCASSSSLSSSSCDQSEDCSRSSSASTTHAGEEDAGLVKPLSCLRLPNCEPTLSSAPVSRNPSLRARRLHCSTSGNHSHHRDGLIKSSSSCDVAASSSSTTCAPNKCPGNADTALGALHRRTVKNFEDAGEQRGDPSLPYADQPVPLALSQHLELTKQVFMQHFSQMRTPEYAERVRAELERERLRQTQLLEHASELEGTIKQMHAHGFELLTAFTKKVRFCCHSSHFSTRRLRVHTSTSHPEQTHQSDSGQSVASMQIAPPEDCITKSACHVCSLKSLHVP
uniref:Histone-lysine N-methyltransferase, H3 lysine-79 specific n=1 Tax=Mesocestoides corti TaxID=53468 RepID=A0A5K3EVZ5_MESCO